MRRSSVHSPSVRPKGESALEHVRRISREHNKPFDPTKRGTWRGSSKDLVVNGRLRKNAKGSMTEEELREHVKAVVDTALSADHVPSEIGPGAVLVGWRDEDRPLVIAVIGATADTRGRRDGVSPDEAVEIATDYGLEERWLREGDASPAYVVQVGGENDPERRARFEDIQNGQFYDIQEGQGYSYSGVTPDENGDWWGSTYTEGSDYSGGSVTQANHKAMLEMCEELSAEHGSDFWQTRASGHGGYHLYFNVFTTPDEIVEALAALDDYPVVDDDALSEQEMENTQEAWDGWAAYEFRKGLEKKFGGDADEISDEDLWTCFSEAQEDANVYWEDQNGEGMWTDVERVLKKVDEPPTGFKVEE